MSKRIWVAGELSEAGNWRILGLYSSAEKAAAVIPPRPAGFIFPYPLDLPSPLDRPGPLEIAEEEATPPS